MAINYELINKGGISLGTNFELLSEKPLDSRLVVPSLTGLQNYIDNAAAYEGMIVFDKDTKKTYQVQVIDGVLSYREFGISEDELKALIAAETTAAMEFKGATATVPTNPAKGDMWKASANFQLEDADVKIGDAIVYNGTEWFIIPSGDDIEDTWRPVDGVANNATLKFVAGDKLDVAVANDGTITYSHEEIAAPVLLAENEQTRTYITEVVIDGHGHITGYKTATENLEDTDTTYEFECQVEEGHSNVHFSVKASTDEHAKEICLDAYTRNEVDEKVKALNLEIYGNEAVQETSRIDTAVADASAAKSAANTAAGDASQAKVDAAEALRVAGEANTAASDAKTGAAASAAAAATSASEALASQNAASESATAAAASESNANTSATTATQKANAASQSASAASQAKSEAEAAKALAEGYSKNASDSATAASGAKDAAEAAQAAAEASNTSATAVANTAKQTAENAASVAGAAKTAADKAIQDVSNVANNGLILSKSADNKVSVDWDSEIVFVFNCGGAFDHTDTPAVSYAMRMTTPSVSSGSDGVFEPDGNANDLTGVEINGQVVDPSHYTVM